MSESPRRVTFVLADTWHTTLRVQHENEWAPYRRRTVTIDLTPEQREALRPCVVGTGGGGREMHEEVLDCYVEHDPPDTEDRQT